MKIFKELPPVSSLSSQDIVVFLGGYGNRTTWADTVVAQLTSFQNCDNLCIFDFDNNNPIDYLRMIKQYRIDVVSIYISKDRDFDQRLVHETELVIDELVRLDYPKRIVTSIESGVNNSQALAIYCELALGVPFVSENANPTTHSIQIYDEYCKIQNNECPVSRMKQNCSKFESFIAKLSYLFLDGRDNPSMCKVARKVCNYDCGRCNWR